MQTCNLRSSDERAADLELTSAEGLIHAHAHICRQRRRIRGAPTKLTEAELARYRSTVYGMAAAVGRVPRMSFGRDRYAMAASAAQVRVY